VAFPLPHLTLGEEIAAAVVRRDTASLTERGILDYAGGRLASFKIPRHIIFLDSLPKSATGKVQRHALAEQFGYPSPDAVAARDTTEVTAATSDVQRKLVTIWAQLLGVGMIGITDNFFSLGGNSLLSIQLLAHIERAFGKQLPLPAVLRAPTIEQLAEVIDHDTWPRTWPSLLPIQPHGSKPPFFWVHGEASNRFLASYVGSDQPLYGFEHQSQEGQPARYTSVKDIGEYYLDQLLSVQSTGVYFLGGFSFGGTIAYEMAQQLIRQGRKVGLLVLLDSHFPMRGGIDEGRKQARPSRKGVGDHAQTLSQLAASERLAYVLSRLRDRVSHQLERASKPLRALQCQLAVRTGRRIPASARNHYLLRMYQKALQAYEPAVYPGRAIYIKSEGRSGAHRASWARLVAGGFESHEMPGNHLDLIKQPYAHAWAERLKDWLDQAQQSSR
jgi:thioesterase domain-containing protein/acyl carrier protein